LRDFRKGGRRECRDFSPHPQEAEAKLKTTSPDHKESRVAHPCAIFARVGGENAAISRRFRKKQEQN
jgi:hypothetical protein